MKILGVILARAGSKRLPGKNTKLLNGKPLIEYTIDAAIESGVIDTLVVSTDDCKVYNLCIDKYKFVNSEWTMIGGENKIIVNRPDYLATDNASSEECILHVMDEVEEHDYVMLLQPTSPLKTSDDIKQCGDLASILAFGYSYCKGKRNGAIYTMEWEDFYETRKIPDQKLWCMPEERSIDIDTPLDFKIAEMLLKERE